MELDLLRQRLRKLETTTPSAPTVDMRFLDDFVQDARVVAIGAGTHGASEFFELQHRITRYLVEAHGFTVIAIEDGLPASRAIDRYVGGSEGSAETALGELYGVWSTHEMLAFVEWIELHNANAPMPVSFHGVDVQSPGESARVVLSFLEARDPTFVVQARELLAPAFELERRWNPRTFSLLAPTLLAGARSVLERFEARAAEYGENASSDEAWWAHRNALALVQLGQKAYDTMPSRDDSMATNVLALLEHVGDAKIVVWAHNAHVMENEASMNRSRASMGVHLAEALGDGYRTIGLVFAQGENRAFDAQSRTPLQHHMTVAPYTVEGQLRRLEVPIFFLDLGGLGVDVKGAWLQQEQSIRWVGWAPNASFAIVRPGLAFDALLFVDTISAAHGVEQCDHSAGPWLRSHPDSKQEAC